MQRRDFMATTGLLAGIGLLPSCMHAQKAQGGSQLTQLKPALLPAQPPLEHNGGMNLRVWMRTSMTNGLFSSVECAVAPKLMGPAPHLHLELDELMYVLDGTASVLVGDEVVHIEAGGWHLRPRNVRHTFWNGSDKPLRFMDMYFNQPFEEYLEKVFFELTPEKGYPFGSAARDAAFAPLNKKFGVVSTPTAGAERAEIVRTYGLR